MGAPGRRQRQGTQTLKIDAMKRPFEVIVMRDVREPEEKRARPRSVQGSTTLSAEQIQREMAREGEDPTQEEVNESIDAFRPEDTILDEAQYKSLSRGLAESFTAEQLHNFFSQSLNLAAVEGDVVQLLQAQPNELEARYQRTQWRPGRTPIEKRLPLGTVVKKSERANKAKTVEQILRLLWKLAIHTEEQKVGELEMKLQSWELSYLFDLRYATPEGGELRTMYERLVDSSFLLRACDLRPYRSRGYLRISGRRQDAEQVAQNIVQRLQHLASTRFELGVFQPLLGTPGWPGTFESLFRQEDIHLVQLRTTSIIEQSGSHVNIHSDTTDRTEKARGLLLYLLELPSITSSTVVADATEEYDRAVPLTQPPSTTLPLRQRKLQLARLTLPTARKLEEGKNISKRDLRTQKINTKSIASTSANVVDMLLRASPIGPKPDVGKTQAYWGVNGYHVKTVPWAAQICTIVSDAKSSSRRPRAKQQRGHKSTVDGLSIVDSRTRGLETLLSYFTPRLDPSQEHPKTRTTGVFAARFVPSPLSQRGLRDLRELPSFELIYRYYTREDGSSDIWLIMAQACLDEQDFHVPLPSEATDVRLHRRTLMRGRGEQIPPNADIMAFTNTLRASLRSSNRTVLVGKSQLRIDMPAALARKAGESESDRPTASATYLFLGFEWRQIHEYSPLPVEKLPARIDPEIKEVMASFGTDLHLQLKEVGAGAFGGRRTEVWLHHSRPYDRPTGPKSLERARSATTENNEDEGSNPANAMTPFEDDQDVENGSVSSPSSPEDTTARLVKTALGLTRLLTKINDGEIQPMTYSGHGIEDRQGQRAESGEAIKEAIDGSRGTVAEPATNSV